MGRTALLTLVAALVAGAAPAAEDRWLHVAVDDGDETVRVNLPMTVALAAAPLIAKHAVDTDLEIGDHELDREELRQLLAALRGAQDGEYVTVEDGEDHVRVSKRGDALWVVVQEQGDGGEQVDVKLPLDVVAALASGEGEEWNFAAAIDALAKHDAGELVTVKDGGETVRIWIDRKPAS
jgi:hypothetical protein